MAFGWFRSRGRDDGLTTWRAAWHEAAVQPADADVERLRQELESRGLPLEDLEVEREMLDGLAAAVAFERQLSTGLPVVETGHRVVGADTCHFIATASLPDVPGQPAGRLLLTNRRAIFAGGASSSTLPWHAVAEATALDRDLILVRRGADTLLRLRCNTFEEALCGRLVARRLAAGAHARGRL
jgi:hypothetical protein